MEPYIGEIMLGAFDFAPSGYAACDGTMLPAMQYQALYSLLGKTYGSSGTMPSILFALPDLRGRVPQGTPDAAGMGKPGGAETVALTIDQMPAHVHSLLAATEAGTSRNPGGTLVFGSVPTGHALFGMPTAANAVPLYAGTLETEGGSAAHDNMQPYSVVNFYIALRGTYPSQQW